MEVTPKVSPNPVDIATTHSLSEARRPGVALGFLFPVLICQGCGRIWPDNADRAAIEQQPCAPELRLIEITICSACLEGVGSGCHTPGCALCLHRVDLPISSEAYRVLSVEESG